MTYKYEFKADYETRKIYFGDWEINHKGYMKRIKDAIKAVKDMDKALSGSEYDGSLYKAFNNTYGITPTRFKKVYNALYQKVWVEPIKKWVLQYGFNSSGKLDVKSLEQLWKVKDDLAQMESDNTEHLAPFLVYMGKTPSEMKERVGKGLWKSLCKNSKTRNKHIAKMARINCTKERIGIFNSIPSTVLKRGNNCNVGREPTVVSALCNHHKLKDIANNTPNIIRDYRVISDTQRMASSLGKETNDQWSLRKWHEKHEEYTREVNAQRYSPTPIEWLVALPESLKMVIDGHLTARLLMSPLDIRTEGDLMRHCVGSYARRVAQGEYLVYHVEDEGNGTTIGLVKGNNRWSVQQHYGKCNSYKDVTDEHNTLAVHICMMVNSYEQGKIE